MLPFALTIFISAFLLFQVQLLLSKHLLPWFGGVPSVWTTSLLFFQVMLLGGYAYAHWLVNRCRPATQRGVHLALLAASLLVVFALGAQWGTPLLPDGRWLPEAEDVPVLHLLALLAMGVGAPFFILSATAPLLQSWYRLTCPGQSPYRLYALSNLGSLLGLLSYPFLFEVLTSQRQQAQIWTGTYVLFALGIGASALRARTAAGTTVAESVVREAPRTPALHVLLWFGLAACASTLLLAITNQLCQEIATLPLLWVLPLSLYLLSFILCFESTQWYSRRFYLPAMIVALALVTLLLHQGPGSHLLTQIAFYTFMLFVGCMVCHGELVRLKPPDQRLTAFYLVITAGGAAGGIFVSLLAPLLFTGYWELGVALLGCTLLVVVIQLHEPESYLRRGARLPGLLILFAAVLVLLVVASDWLPEDAPQAQLDALGNWLYILPAVAVLLGLLLSRFVPALVAGTGHLLHMLRARFVAAPDTGTRPDAATGGMASRLTVVLALALFGLTQYLVAQEHRRDALVASRNFYGHLAVVEEHRDDPLRHQYKLVHGRIVHGLQYQSGARRLAPGAYYSPNSGVGLAIAGHPRRRAGAPLHLGVVGLGAGMLATHARAGDSMRFYEINPEVVRLATGPEALFTYLRDTPATVETIIGDARLELERELARSARRHFHLLVLDAFSGDAVPVHLLTREAFAIYLRRLDPETGMLAVHITNQHIDLKPVIGRLAEEYRLATRVVIDDSDGDWHNTWIVLARQPALLADIRNDLPPSAAGYGTMPLWTDDFSNLLQILRIRAPVPASVPDGACVSADCLPFLDTLERPGNEP